MKSQFKHFLKIFVAVLVFGVLVVMTGQTEAGAEPKSEKKIKSLKINVSGGELLINKRETKKLKVKIKPSKGIDKKLKWKSSKKSVVSVTQKGKIKGKKYGRAYISVRAEDGSGKKARIRVRVGKKVSKVILPSKSMELDVGKTASIQAQVSPANATKRKVKYQSSNKSVATVSSSGVVRGKGKGTATITVSSTDGSGKKALCKVAVKIPTSLIQLDVQNGQLRLEAGTSITINAVVKPDNASNKKIHYTSTNPAAAKVSQLGVVTGVSPGLTTIRVDAADGRSSASVDVEVYKVELQKEKLIAHRGFSSAAPENTTAAFELAVQNGFYGIECDVRKTYDGEFVIMHDADLNRMCGYNLNIANMDLDQLKQYTITAGSNIDSYPELTVPALEEYLQILEKSDTVHPFIELKEALTEPELKEITELVKKYGLLDRTYFISVHKSNLLTLKTISGVNQEFLQYVYGAESSNKLVPVDDSVISWCISNAIDLDARHTLITADEVSRLHDSGRKVNVWTVNDGKRAYELVKDFCVDMITTEYFLQS
ncbi:MAG: Ig-like domain-containing protein [Roseburia sp.]|nr:Ig-like domain-containing protein [Roseburia sp.]